MLTLRPDAESGIAEIIGPATQRQVRDARCVLPSPPRYSFYCRYRLPSSTLSVIEKAQETNHQGPQNRFVAGRRRKCPGRRTDSTRRHYRAPRHRTCRQSSSHSSILGHMRATQHETYHRYARRHRDWPSSVAACFCVASKVPRARRCQCSRVRVTDPSLVACKNCPGGSHTRSRGWRLPWNRMNRRTQSR